MKKYILIIITAILILSCSNKDKGNNNSQLENATRSQETGSVIVKGFSIGMQKAAAEENLAQKCGAVKDYIILTYDEHNRLSSVFMNSIAVENLFNSKGMPLKEFADKFKNSYAVPGMDDEEKKGDDGEIKIKYEYTSKKEGWQILIYGNENTYHLMLSRIFIESETNFGD
jgi:hypothetical protein